MKKNRIILFGAFLYILAIGNILSPNGNFSPNENRFLKQFPEFTANTLFSGKFGKEFEEFATDQFIFRDKWIGLKTRGDLALQKRDNGRVYFGRDNYLFDISEDINKDRLSRNIASINILLKKLEEKGLNANFLLVPTKGTVIFDRLPLFAPINDEEIIVNIMKKELNNNANIIELSDYLKEKRRESIYFRTDHHWTTRGAFFSYEYLMNSLGKKSKTEEDYIIKTVSDNFLGSNYRMVNFFRGEPDIIEKYIPIDNIDIKIVVNRKEKRDSLYVESFLSTSDQFSFFLGGDNALIEIESSANNNESILIIKDSFANNFVPFLTNHYRNITMVDTRFFSESMINFIESNDFDEILFVMNIQNYHKERTLFRLGT